MQRPAICKDCIHYRVPTLPDPFRYKAIASPALMEESARWQEELKERARGESAAAQSQDHIQYQPWFEPWCAELTSRVREQERSSSSSNLYVLTRQGNRDGACQYFRIRSDKLTGEPEGKSVPRGTDGTPTPTHLEESVSKRAASQVHASLRRRYAGDEKITVAGHLSLGTALALEKKVVHVPSAFDDVLEPPANSPLPVYEQYDPLNLSNSRGTRLSGYEYSLVHINSQGSQVADLSIEGDGLTQSYGIFGGPGSGKTNLLKHLLAQVVQTPFAIGDPPKPDQPDVRQKLMFGGLILDPKGVLLEDVLTVMEGRIDDLIVINDAYMRESGKAENIIHSFLRPLSLGSALAMAAQSAGVSASEPFWLNELQRIFGAALDVLSLYQSTVPTLADLVELLLGVRNTIDGPKSALYCTLQVMDEEYRTNRSSISPEQYKNFTISSGILRRFDSYAKDDKLVLESFIEQCYGLFRRSEYEIFCKRLSKNESPKSIYDQVIEDGKVILVSLSKQNLAISRLLCTLVKVLFQQTIITRLDRKYRLKADGWLNDIGRPVFFLADEYSDVATELPGQPMGDSLFFSQSRQFGCLGLIATQSIHMLENSPLGRGWKAIYSNFTAKIFQRVGDPETATEASDLAGVTEYDFESYDRSFSHDGTSRSQRWDIRDRRELPIRVLTRGLNVGEAVVIGSLQGGNRPGVRFVRIPKYQPKS